MRLRRIEVRNFRKLRGPICIDNLGDGLTVIAGDNEDGKSTLLLALKAALFLKYKATVTEDFLPFGSKVRPELRLDLEFFGRPYSLYKAFCQNPRAELVTPTGKLEGMAAEEELARLLRFDSPAKANSAEPKSEHQGLCGLLWVTQGESFRNHQAASSLQRDLQSALESEVGSVLTGELGRKLLQVFRDRHDENYTKTGQPRDELKKAREKVEQLAGKLAGLRERQRDYEGKVDRLGDLRDKLRRYDEDGTLAKQKSALQKDEAALLLLSERERALAALQKDVTLSEERLELLRQKQKRRLDGRETVRLADEELLKLDVRKQQGLVGISTEEQLWNDAVTRRKKKSDEHSAASAEVSLLRRSVDRQRLSAELFERNSRLGEVETLEKRKNELADQLVRLVVDDKQLAKLRELHRLVREREVELHAVATLLEVAVTGTAELWLDGQPVSEPATTRIVTDRTELVLPGVKLVITPGRTGAARLRESLQTEQAKLLGQLAELGVADLLTAEQEAANRRAVVDEQRELMQHLGRLCPSGVAALREEIVRLTRQLVQLGDETEPSLPQETLLRQLGERQQLVESLSRELVLCDEEVERKRLLVEKLRNQQAEHDGRLSQQRREVERLKKQLDDESAQCSDAELDVSVQAQKQVVLDKRAQAEMLENELKAADLDGIRQNVSQNKAAIDELSRHLLGLTQKAQELQIELRTLGQQAIDEELAETQAAYERAQVELSHKTRRAEAIRLLYESMQAHDQRSREAYLGPLLRLCEPYLQAILPGCRLAINESTLAIEGLWRGEQLEPFVALSLGTREQLAIVVRLAVADLMAQRGQSVPLLLDDALTFCDDARFDRMLRLLRRGASRHQIILLTCHEREFLRSGAKLLRLVDCQAA